MTKHSEATLKLARKYYGTDDLTKLSQYQLDKLVTWTLGYSVKRGANKDRRAGRSKGRFAK